MVHSVLWIPRTPGVVLYAGNKRGSPGQTKEVQEDSTDNSWGDENTAEIGDTVEFQHYDLAHGLALHRATFCTM